MTRVVVAQLDCAVRDASRDGLREQAVTAVERGADRGAALVVLPEYASGWTAQLGPELAEPLDGPFVAAVRSACRRRSVGAVVGVLIPGEGGQERRTNLAVAVGPGGDVLGTYAKVHLFDAFGVRESDVLTPGAATAAPLVVTAGGLSLGVITCYDLRFPESARRVVDAGADVLVVIAAWASGPGKAEQLSVLARARAIENTSYLVLASQHGSGRTGHSAVVDPLGVVLQEAGADGDATLTADLDPAVVAGARERVPVLAHRRYAVVPAP